MLTVKVDFKATDTIVKKRGLENFGRVHQNLNSTLLSYCEPYIPKETGALIQSGQSHLGYLSWSAPYAKKQYYQNKGTGLRGRLWFQRMWAARKGEILASVNQAAKNNTMAFSLWKGRKII